MGPWVGQSVCVCLCKSWGRGEKETQFLSVIVTSYWGVFTDPKVMKESFPSSLFLKLLREITLSGKESACQTGDVGSIPGSERSPRGGNSNLFHILAGIILWTEQPGGLWGRKESNMTEETGHTHV